MSFRTSATGLPVLAIVVSGCWGASSVDAGKSAPPGSIPTMSTR